MTRSMGNPGHTERRANRWTWFEIGSLILYGAAIGVSIAIALADLQIWF